MENYHLFDETAYELSAGWDKKSAAEAFGRLIKRRKDLTAVFVTNDQMAFGVYEYARKHGIRIPEDISVIGLTTFRQSTTEIGDIAAQMMLDQIDGKQVPPIIRCRAEIVERNSVKTIKGLRFFG